MQEQDWSIISLEATLFQPAAMYNSKGSSSNLLQDVIVIIDTLLSLDVHGLRHVLGVDVEHELVVVLDLALLASDLLPVEGSTRSSKMVKN